MYVSLKTYLLMYAQNNFIETSCTLRSCEDPIDKMIFFLTKLRNKIKSCQFKDFISDLIIYTILRKYFSSESPNPFGLPCTSKQCSITQELSKRVEELELGLKNINRNISTEDFSPKSKKLEELLKPLDETYPKKQVTLKKYLLKHMGNKTVDEFCILKSCLDPADRMVSFLMKTRNELKSCCFKEELREVIVFTILKKYYDSIEDLNIFGLTCSKEQCELAHKLSKRIEVLERENFDGSNRFFDGIKLERKIKPEVNTSSDTLEKLLEIFSGDNPKENTKIPVNEDNQKETGVFFKDNGTISEETSEDFLDVPNTSSLGNDKVKKEVGLNGVFVNLKFFIPNSSLNDTNLNRILLLIKEFYMDIPNNILNAAESGMNVLPSILMYLIENEPIDLEMKSIVQNFMLTYFKEEIYYWSIDIKKVSEIAELFPKSERTSKEDYALMKNLLIKLVFKINPVVIDPNIQLKYLILYMYKIAEEIEEKEVILDYLFNEFEMAPLQIDVYLNFETKDGLDIWDGIRYKQTFSLLPAKSRENENFSKILIRELKKNQSLIISNPSDLQIFLKKKLNVYEDGSEEKNCLTKISALISSPTYERAYNNYKRIVFLVPKPETMEEISNYLNLIEVFEGIPPSLFHFDSNFNGKKEYMMEAFRNILDDEENYNDPIRDSLR